MLVNISFGIDIFKLNDINYFLFRLIEIRNSRSKLTEGRSLKAPNSSETNAAITMLALSISYEVS